MDNVTINLTENIDNITVNTTQTIDNITATITENVEQITINISNTRGADGLPGEQGLPGEDGEDGYTPIKGVDYFDGNILATTVRTGTPTANRTIEVSIDGTTYYLLASTIP
jgi:hypothetical protein